MPKTSKPNLILLINVAVLVVFGLLMIMSAEMAISAERFNQSFHYVKSQILKGLIPGMILGYIAYLIPYPFWRKFAKPIFLASLILLALVFIPKIGMEFSGAKRWINVWGISFQPSELAKLAFVIFIAYFLEHRGALIKNRDTLYSFLVTLAVVGLLIAFQPDIGTLGVFALTGVAMYFIAGAPLKYIFVLCGLGLAALAAMIKFFPHASQRIQVLFHPELDPKGIGYQIDQILIALGSGGIFGQGLAQSKQKFLYLPQPVGDSIAAVIGEELGFIGLTILAGLFVAFAIQGFKIARNAPDQFAKFLATGITCLIVIQAFINIMATIGLIPLTGVTLPFISHGGSSLVVSLIGVGILLNISKYEKR
ncbi:MAG: putative lipid II flippase FtsW [Candidatus Portnoybacteria bacterium]|nr:putative lipid II flippase FtsW [Candidatus Portnoybacteria bacterium]